MPEETPAAAPVRRRRVISPCVAICRLDAAGRVCLGCKRTSTEIARWTTMSEDEREALLALLPGRPDPAAASA